MTVFMAISPNPSVAEAAAPSLAIEEIPKSMQDLANKFPDNLKALKAGDVVEGFVLSVGKNEVLLSIPQIGVGVVRGRELYDDKTYLSNLKAGTPVMASVLDPDNDAGMVELSFRQAGHERVWLTLREKMEGKEIIATKILDANKGGLLIEINGVTGFLPVSQLTTEHYPRVEDGAKDKILEILKSYVGQNFHVQIITADPKEEKLIVSEKAVIEPELEQKMEKLKVGDVIEGTITGVVDFGAFVKFNKDETLEGLVHISELAWQRIDDPKDIAKVGDQVKAQIISIDDNRISLSIKRLQQDPWQDAVKKYKPGDIVKGTVTKLLPFGAFVELDQDIQGLAHIGELAEPAPKDPSEVLKSGEEREFKIINIEPEEHRLGLSLKALTRPEQKPEESASEKPVEESAKPKADEAVGTPPAETEKTE